MASEPAASTEKLPLAPVHGEGGELLASWLAPTFLLFILIGSMLLRRSGVMVNGGELSYPRSLFLCISAATLTGFQQSIGTGDFNPDSILGPAVILILVLMGSLFALIVGGLAAVRALRMKYSDLQVITFAVTAELFAILTGAALLHMRGIIVIDSIFAAACAFGNCGALLTGRGHFLPPFNSIATQGILLPLAILGGLGLPVLMDLYYRMIGSIPRLSIHTRTVITLAAGIYLASTAILLVAAIANDGALTDGDFIGSLLHVLRHPTDGAAVRPAFLAASTTAINSRTLGLPFDILHHFPKQAWWFIILLMMIGASPAGTGSGLKTTTLWRLFTGVRDALAGRAVSRVVGIAAVWTAAYLIIAAATFFLLTCFEPQVPVDRLAFITISAVSNVGLGHDRDPINIVGPGLVVLCLAMLLGRLVPLGVLWWLARTTPEADVLVG